MLRHYLAHVPQVDAFKAIQKPNLVSHFVHKQPQLGLRRDPESSKSFQEPQANWTPTGIQAAGIGCVLACPSLIAGLGR